MARSPGKGVPPRLGTAPLRMIITGHNPSETSWEAGHYYAHKSNRMWPILTKTGIAPPTIRGCEDDARMAPEAGVGFLDVGCGHVGTDSSKFNGKHFSVWAQSYYAHLEGHLRAAAAAIGCTCGRCADPVILCFAGKKQFAELLALPDPAEAAGRGNRKRKASEGGQAPRIEYGKQPSGLRPRGLPFGPSTEIWVLTSTSGAAPMTNEEREAPWRQLAARLAREPWPRRVKAQCAVRGGECEAEEC